MLLKKLKNNRLLPDFNILPPKTRIQNKKWFFGGYSSLANFKGLRLSWFETKRFLVFSYKAVEK